jgi:hypothetical protein
MELNIELLAMLIATIIIILLIVRMMINGLETRLHKRIEIIELDMKDIKGNHLPIIEKSINLIILKTVYKY